MPVKRPRLTPWGLSWMLCCKPDIFFHGEYWIFLDFSIAIIHILISCLKHTATGIDEFIINFFTCRLGLFYFSLRSLGVAFVVFKNPLHTDGCFHLCSLSTVAKFSHFSRIKIFCKILILKT